MRRQLLGVLLSALLCAGCIRSSLEVSRFTCQSDDDCDKGAGESCRGVAAEVDDACDDDRSSSGPYYLTEPGLKTCILFYCTKQSTGLTCGKSNCVEGRTCFAFKDDSDNVELECGDRATLESAASCNGLSDADTCGGGRCVRFLEVERENAKEEPTYRCLSDSA